VKDDDEDEVDDPAVTAPEEKVKGVKECGPSMAGTGENVVVGVTAVTLKPPKPFPFPFPFPFPR
jgi:hypothetical protein